MRYSLIIMCLSFGMLPSFVFASEGVRLRCQIEVVNRQNSIIFNQEGEVALTEATTPTDLQMIISGQDLRRAYAANVVVMGSKLRDSRGEKIKLGIYILDSDYILLPSAQYWRAPIGSDLEGYYARPIAEMSFKYISGGDYQLDVGRRIGMREQITLTRLKCSSINQ